ncbi:MAG TPA: polyprenyl diphosphate synthase [Spirochaetia bacterium]|nr:polyprenyl diphosphate synthase [Spirochaetia bacterium]
MPGPRDATIDRTRLPRHVGIVMDGFDRWISGHDASRRSARIAGLRAAWNVVLAARSIGIGFLSFYPFPGDRSSTSIFSAGVLLRIMRNQLQPAVERYGVRVVHSGDTSDLSVAARNNLESIERMTESCAGIVVNLAFNDGGRSEIVRAVNRWLSDGIARSNEGTRTDPAAAVTEEALREHLDLPEFPEPDLIIQSGGERRISNFLLWESAYSEFLFSDTLWPDWTGDDFEKSIAEYQHRSRRFGGA